jgi:hypothetical protein
MAEANEGLKTTERLAWLGFLLFLVVVLAIYIGRGLGLEHDVQEANQRLLEAQIRLAHHTQGDITRPAAVGLTQLERQRLQQRGFARPEEQLRTHLLTQTALIPHTSLLGGTWYFLDEEIHLLNDRWVLAAFEDGHVRGKMLLEYRLAPGSITWQVLESYVE